MFKQKKLQIGLILFFLALGMRLSIISTARFTYDEASFYETALHIAQGKEIPLLGTPLTAGKARHPGPYFYWMMATTQMAGTYPEAVNALVAFLGAATVVIVWLGLCHLFTLSSASWSALWMAFAPWSVLYSDRIWNSNVIGFFIAISFYSMIVWKKEKNITGWFFLIWSLSLLPHFHLSAPVILVAVVTYLLKDLRSIGRREIGCVLLVILLSYWPYIGYEIGHNFENTRLILGENVGQSHRSLKALWQVPIHFFRFLTLDTAYHQLSGYWHGFSERMVIQTYLHGSEALPWNPLRLLTMIGSFLFILLILSKLKAFFIRYRQMAWAILAGVVANILLLLLSGKKIFPHYIHPLIPFSFVLLSFVLEEFRERKLAVLLVLMCFYGGESSYKISHNLDALNGLKLQKAVLEQINSETNGSVESIGLKVGYFSSLKSYQVLQKALFPESPLRIREEHSQSQYLLLKSKQALPKGEYIVSRQFDRATLYKRIDL